VAGKGGGGWNEGSDERERMGKKKKIEGSYLFPPVTRHTLPSRENKWDNGVLSEGAVRLILIAWGGIGDDEVSLLVAGSEQYMFRYLWAGGGPCEWYKSLVRPYGRD